MLRSAAVTNSSASKPTDRFYQGAGGREYHEGKRKLAPGVLDWLLRLRAEKFQPRIQPSDVVFEYGVGSGWNLGRLRCQRRLGFDCATFLAEGVAALGIEFIAETGLIANSLADVVLCHHTLEHLLAPTEALHEIFRILRPGGKLILHVPWERERRYAQFDSREPNHHLYTWNGQALGNLLGVTGFEVREIRTRRYGYDRFAANTAKKLRLGEPGFRLLRRLLIGLRPLREVEAIAQKPAAG